MSWLNSIFSTKQPKTVDDIMSEYGGLLEKYPLAIMDISMLPIPKVKMKVILKALYAQARTTEDKNWFETGFMILSNFQDGVGAKPIDCKLPEGTTKADIQAGLAIMDKWILWQKLSAAEMEILLTEWRRFKAGEPI